MVTFGIGDGHSKRLDGKRALITGAAGGIAQAIATDFVREGAELVLTDLEIAPMNPFAETLKEAGATPILMAADLTRRSDVENLAERSRSIGGIDILVTCAGNGCDRGGGYRGGGGAIG